MLFLNMNQNAFNAWSQDANGVLQLGRRKITGIPRKLKLTEIDNLCRTKIITCPSNEIFMYNNWNLNAMEDEDISVISFNSRGASNQCAMNLINMGVHNESGLVGNIEIVGTLSDLEFCMLLLAGDIVYDKKLKEYHGNMILTVPKTAAYVLNGALYSCATGRCLTDRVSRTKLLNSKYNIYNVTTFIHRHDYELRKQYSM